VPYQLVPSELNAIISIRLAVFVIVGAVFAGHLTPVNVPVKLPAPDLISTKNDLPATAVGIVNVQLAVNVTVCTVPLDRAIVCVVDELPIATTLSV